ncbi:DUF6894 family protein [Methylobacterium nigriterrae]|uniref:DUF6894 family protein n=1 Tax=Methylobacterium nigriterrae TaxID=3127512 RepID=UPI00301358BE
MPRFYFDVRTPSGVVCSDYQGLDCPDAAAALEEAHHGARFVTPGECARNPLFSGYKFAVTDEAHRLLFTVPFTELQLADDEPEPPAAPGRSPARRKRTRPGAPARARSARAG